MSLIGKLFGDEDELIADINKLSEALKAWKRACEDLDKSATLRLKQNDKLIQDHESLKYEIAQLNQTNDNLKKQAGSAIILKQSEKENALMQDLALKSEELLSIKQELKNAGQTIEMLKGETGLMFVAEDTETVGYGRVNKQGIRLDLIRIKKKHLSELPEQTENGNDIFEDGSHYPASIMDFIRKERNDSPRQGKKEEAAPIEPLNQNTPDEPDENIVAEADNNEKSEEEPEGTGLTGLTPNQQRVLDFIETNPNTLYRNKQLAEGLNMDEATTSKNVKALFDFGFLKRENGFLALS
ncbi:MAG: helix-turn-helix domain-containing protein [Candidatus Methanoperedens sp.]